MKSSNKTPLFLILVLGISFLSAAGFRFSGGELSSMGGLVFSVAYMFIPLLVTLIVSKWIYKESIKKPLFISRKINRWWLLAWLLPVVIWGLTIAISLLWPDVSFSWAMEGLFAKYTATMSPEQVADMQAAVDLMPFHPVWLALIQWLIAGITVNALAGFGEEIGRRGFLVRQFRHMHFAKASLIIWAIRGIRHAPLILMGHNYPQHPEIGVAMMVVWCLLLSPIFLYILVKSKSVIAASILHGTLNGTAGIALIVLVWGSDLTIWVTWLAGFVALILVIWALCLVDHLSKEKIMTEKISKHLS